jgi:NADH:ubiquinone oxidoreductase subunit E
MPATTGQAMSPADRADEIAAAHLALEGPLLPILHAVQAEFGHVPAEALPRIARRLNISKAEVHGVVSFYHDFREAPAGRHVVKLCRAEACQAMGADALVARAEARLGGGDARDHARRGGDAGAGLLPWAFAPAARRRWWTGGSWGGSTRRGSTRSSTRWRR